MPRNPNNVAHKSPPICCLHLGPVTVSSLHHSFFWESYGPSFMSTKLLATCPGLPGRAWDYGVGIEWASLSQPHSIVCRRQLRMEEGLGVLWWESNAPGPALWKGQPMGTSWRFGGTWGQQWADLIQQMQDSGWNSETGQHPSVSEKLRDGGRHSGGLWESGCRSCRGIKN